jgi:hypothetical protein
MDESVSCLFVHWNSNKNYITRKLVIRDLYNNKFYLILNLKLIKSAFIFLIA